MKFSVGDAVMLQLWSGPPRQAEVTKVGRRWVTVDGGRQFDGETGKMKGPYFGWIRTLDEYAALVAAQELLQLWQKLRERILCLGHFPTGLSADQLERILAILEETRHD